MLYDIARLGSKFDSSYYYICSQERREYGDTEAETYRCQSSLRSRARADRIICYLVGGDENINTSHQHCEHSQEANGLRSTN